MSKQKASKWFWSHRDEGNGFSGPHDTREAAVQEALEQSEPGQVIYVGKSEIVEVEVDADVVIDNWLNSSFDLLYEDALEYWCHKVSLDDLAKLSQDLSKVFKKHLARWGEPTSWVVIRNIEKYLPEQEKTA
jgi:hypothetical protein